MLPKLPHEAENILKAIAGAGGQGFVVGEALCALLRAEKPQKWQFAATLPSGALQRVLPAAAPVQGGEGPHGFTFEMKGGVPSLGHVKIKLVSNILDELARQDFTVDAMAYNGEVLFDPYGGQQDIRRHLLRCVGNPDEKFSGRPLLVLYLFMQMAKLSYGAENKTYRAASRAMPGIATLPPGVVRAALEEILLGKAPELLGTLVAKGGLQPYGFYFAPALACLADVPALPLCRWWAFCALCGTAPAKAGGKLGFSPRLIKELDEVTRLYRLGPSQDKLMLKMKLRHALLDYAPIAATFAEVSPNFIAEPMLYGQVRQRGEPFRPAHLAIGCEMLEKQGLRGVKRDLILEELLKAVIKNPALNRRGVLLGLARELKGLL